MKRYKQVDLKTSQGFLCNQVATDKSNEPCLNKTYEEKIELALTFQRIELK